MAAMARALAFGWSAESVYRGVATGAIAGALAGILVGGIGGRLAMRLAGAMSDPSLVGAARTNNGNILGEITFGGTVALVIFAGLLPGILAGLIYVAARPWLAPLGRWGGPAYGLVLLAAIGPAVLEPFNIDFGKFGSPPVNVAIFALLFPLFGIVVAALWALVSRRWSASPGPAGEVAGIFAVLAAAAVVVIAGGALVAVIVNGRFEGDPRGFLLLYFLGAPLLLRTILGRSHALTDAREIGSATRVVSYAALLAPAVLGLPSTVEAIRFLSR